MSLKTSSARSKRLKKTRHSSCSQQRLFSLLAVWAMVLSSVTACAPSLPNLSAAPTQPLIPAAPTLTPTPTPPPTATRTLLPAAGDLALTVTAPPQTAITALLDAARRDLAARQGVPLDRIDALAQESVQWRDETLDCGNATPRTPRRIAGYRLALLLDETVYMYHTDMGQTVRLCAQGNLYDDYPQYFLARDLIAAEMAELAQARLGRELDLSSRLVTLVSARPMIWTDSSLGCPVDGQTYSPAETRGYRLEFEVSGQRYVFHTDFESILLCANAP